MPRVVDFCEAIRQDNKKKLTKAARGETWPQLAIVGMALSLRRVVATNEGEAGMHHLRRTRPFLLPVGLCLGAMLLPTASSAREDSGAVASRSAPRSYHFTNRPPLLNVVKKTLKGDKTKDGNCIWHPATLTLAPQDRALEQRQVSADYTNCTTVVEIGNPTQIDPIDPGEELSSTLNNAGKRATRTTATARRLASSKYTVYSSKAYYKVTWYDWINQPLNYVRSILTWYWRSDGGCITGSLSEWAEWHQIASGWTNTSWDKWKTTSCTDHRTHSSADFRNNIFCTPPSTYTHYRNVRIRGGYTGTYGAALDSTWTDGTQCGPLHWSGQVVKEF